MNTPQSHAKPNIWGGLLVPDTPAAQGKKSPSSSSTKAILTRVPDVVMAVSEINPQERNKIFSLPIDKTHIPTKIYLQYLRNAGLHYIGDLAKLSEVGLLAKSNMTRKVINQVQKALQKYNLTFSMNMEGWVRPE